LDTGVNHDGGHATGKSPGRWRFAGMEVDEASGRLRVGGIEHALDHGSYGVLLALLRQSGQVVAKDALLHAGWPGRVVSENSLTKAISRLRHELDDADGELLCTSHGYGYRLTARAEWSPAGLPEVSPAAIETISLPPPAANEDPGPRRSRRSNALTLALAALLAIVAGAWWFSTRDAATPVLANPARSAAPIADPGRSIAVLPFEDLSASHDQAYFSDGLADELLDRLAKLPQLHVASRTSAFTFRDSKQGIEEIGRKLGVATVLEGSVRRDGDRVRITVQLINVSNGFHLWSETYDKKMTDLFDVQDDIARSVVSALQVQLLPGQDQAVTRHRTKSPQAFDMFLTGQKFRAFGGPDNDRRAIAAYERAIALDPEFSTAYAELAVILGGDAEYADSPEQVREGKQRAIEYFSKAIALEPDRAELYSMRADQLFYTRHDWRGAQRDLETASRLNRRRSNDVLQKQTRLLAVLGRLDEAIALEQETVRKEPDSTWAWGQLGFHLTAQGRYAEAHQALATALKIRPDDNHVGYYAGLAWLLDGNPKEAVAAFERSGSVFRLAGLAAAQFDAGNEAASQEALDTLITRHAPIGAYQVAQAYAWRGEKDKAFEWLERAERQYDAGLAQLKFDPMMQKLRADPRYKVWLKRLKLDDDAALRAI
jgi:TolB-like protein/DNA-binding winged helix-turn-helix (wHTH) protein/tetratricopeptide (TPR) repeat protein